MKITDHTGASEQIVLAVLCADIYEYSKRTSEDHVGTHRALKQRFEIVEDIVNKNIGQVIRFQGDSVLITFDNIRNAIYCATEIQTASHKHNFKLPILNKLLFRIGISYGSVISEDGEPFGAAVNTAKRLEELADPGGIYISSDASEALDGSLPFPINYRGRVRVKNLEKPIVVNEISQYEPLSVKKSNNVLLKHPIDRTYLGTFSLLILGGSVIILALSIIMLIYALTLLK